MSESNFSIAELFNELSELVYVSDPLTYELYFINESAKALFGITGDPRGHKCYEALQGLSAPCPFCTNDRLAHDRFYSWEIYNQKLGRHYFLKDKFIYWEGREARFEIAFDMTEKENQREMLKNALDAEVMVLNCIKRLNSEENFDRAIDKVLENIAVFLRAERAYIFEIRDGLMDNTFEWCAPDVLSQIDKLQRLPMELIASWRKFFDSGLCRIIYDLERDLSPDTDEEYDVLRMQDVHSLVAAPLLINGKLAGYLGVDNPPAERIQHISPLLITLANFIAGSMQRRDYQRQLEEMSFKDMLTGLRNRNAFIRDVKELSRIGFKSLGVVYVDVNGLKRCNDQHGHAAGDTMIINTANAILSVFKEAEDRAYRIGGDEFVVLSADSEKEKFCLRAGALKNMISEKEAFSLSFSLGWRWGSSDYDVKQLLTEADEEMYSDKKKYYRGKSIPKRYRVCSDELINLGDPLYLQQLLEAGNFLVHYQPKVSMTDHRPLGAEALARFLSSDGTLIAPGQFIPLLEANGLVWMLDFWVFGAVCRQLRQWLDDGVEALPVSVNFSRDTVSGESFVNRLLEIWSQWNVPKELIEIEITENANFDEDESFFFVVEKVREAGFNISIDDFGARYSNLSLFATLAFDVLKIDRGLVKALPNNPTAFAVLKSITDICKKKKISVIAEGVETEQQLNALLEIGCDGLQGYCISRPVPVVEYQEKYLKTI
ncbi:MAG: GGDEF domain-containing protein [Synergistaceae bacterium]|nr:GGDEF domain-containing protein [Synergistaceae bacterium]